MPLVWLRTSCSQQPGSLRDRPAGRLTRSTGRRSSGELQGRALLAAPRRCALPVRKSAGRGDQLTARTDVGAHFLTAGRQMSPRGSTLFRRLSSVKARRSQPE